MAYVVLTPGWTARRLSSPAATRESGRRLLSIWPGITVFPITFHCPLVFFRIYIVVHVVSFCSKFVQFYNRQQRNVSRFNLRRGARVAMACRDMERARAAAEDVKKQVSNREQTSDVNSRSTKQYIKEFRKTSISLKKANDIRLKSTLMSVKA